MPSVILAEAGGYQFNMATALASIWSLAESALNFITDHELTAILFVCSLIPIGFGIIKLAKGAAKRG